MFDATELILTPNRRLCAYLHEQYAIRQKFEKVWHTPPIHPLTAWMTLQWEVLQHESAECPPTLLSPIQQTLVFEQVIQASAWGACSLRTEVTAEQAVQAWNTCVQWRCWPTEQTDYFLQMEDTRAFYEWSLSYQNILKQRHWTDAALWVEHLIQAIAVKAISIPSRIRWVGFQDLNPQQKQLFEAMQQAGSGVEIAQVPTGKPCVQRMAFINDQAEIQAAAEHAAECLKNNPAERVGIIVLDLHQQRDRVQEIFNQHFKAHAYNMSAPLPLFDYPLIQSALQAIQILQPEISFEKWSQFLRSPFMWDKSLQCGLHELELVFRSTKEIAFTWPLIFNFLQQRTQCQAILQQHSTLEQIFKNIPHWLETMTDFKTSHEWVEWIGGWLNAFGWPHLPAATQLENHLLAGWQQINTAYLKLDLQLRRHSLRRSFQILQRLAKQTPFLPEVQGVNLQVLGLLEGLGVPFDHLWIVGVDQENWPMEPKPNPFIPLKLQRAFNMPRGSSEREWMVAKSMTEILSQGAFQHVIFSHALMVGDQARRVSELIVRFPERERIQIDNRSAPRELLERPKKNLLEILWDQDGGRCEDVRVAGGANVLKWQALCPMRAYGEFRLGAFCLTKPSLGLTLQERGELVHQVMHRFWQQTRTQTQLLYLKQRPLELEQRLQTHIDAMLEQWQRRRPQALQTMDRQIEGERLKRLILDWLSVEMERLPFEIHSLEEKRTLQVGPLHLDIRVDRIDQIEKGDRLIIDYKTGDTRVNEWFGERLAEPQLPLYCLLPKISAAGVVFAEMRVGRVRFKGVTQDILLVGVPSFESLKHPEKSISWTFQLKTWENTFRRLAKDFWTGVARIIPREGLSTCRQCHLQSFCRVHEVAL